MYMIEVYESCMRMRDENEGAWFPKMKTGRAYYNYMHRKLKLKLRKKGNGLRFYYPPKGPKQHKRRLINSLLLTNIYIFNIP